MNGWQREASTPVLTTMCERRVTVEYKGMVESQGMMKCSVVAEQYIEADTALMHPVFIHAEYAKYGYVSKLYHIHPPPTSTY